MADSHYSPKILSYLQVIDRRSANSRSVGLSEGTDGNLTHPGIDNREHM